MVKKKLYELVNNEWVREIVILLIVGAVGFFAFKSLPGILNLLLKVFQYE